MIRPKGRSGRGQQIEHDDVAIRKNVGDELRQIALLQREFFGEMAAVDHQLR
jgi:hypothetical protein